MSQSLVVCLVALRNIIIGGILTISLSAVAWAQCGTYSCPACYSDAPPRPAQNGTVYIAIDSSWNDPNTGQPNT